MKKSFIFNLLLFSFISASSYAFSPVASGKQCYALFAKSADKPSYRFQDNDASRTLSQLVRDNHLDYSYFVKSYAQRFKETNPELYPLLEKLIQYKGWIAGDNHTGNYIVSPVNGKLKYYFVDIKDGGFGPLFYNFSNLVLNTHAVTKRTNSAKIYEVADFLIESYIRGLKNESMSVPAVIREALLTKTSEYSELQNTDVQRFLNTAGKFKIGKKNLAPLNGSVEKIELLKSKLTQHLLNTGDVASVNDFAIRLKERGGSKDLDRIWALVENTSGQTRIYEFKEVNIPAAQAVEKSGLTLLEHTEKMMSVYFPEPDPSIKPVMVDGALYMMRPRKVDLVSVPYKQKKVDQLVELIELARYAAYQTGRKQAATANSPIRDYIHLIEKEGVEFQLIIRTLIKDYYKHLEEKIDTLP